MTHATIRIPVFLHALAPPKNMMRHEAPRRKLTYSAPVYAQVKEIHLRRKIAGTKEAAIIHYFTNECDHQYQGNLVYIYQLRQQ